MLTVSVVEMRPQPGALSIFAAALILKGEVNDLGNRLERSSPYEDSKKSHE